MVGTWTVVANGDKIREEIINIMKQIWKMYKVLSQKNTPKDPGPQLKNWPEKIQQINHVLNTHTPTRIKGNAKFNKDTIF